jgi:predicted ArsR family transcriptional regulator
MQRMLGGTRGQIIALLRRSSRTVNELAAAMGVTDNAVRPHLTALERDGLVEQRSVRRGVGKPAYVYHLTAEADALLPKAYGPLLSLLLSTLSDRMAPEAVEELLRDVGRRVAAAQPVPGGDPRARIDAAVGVLGALGGVADIEETDDAVWIRGCSCPLAAIVPEHPEACQLAEALLTEVIGVPVHEHCDKGDRPRCCFHVALERQTAA